MENESPINDVRRKLNEVMKQTNERIVVGWRPEMAERKEGDVWEDANGKQWTVRNGITQSISKMDDAKTPWFCPKCEKAMNHKLDFKFWRIRGHCFDCNIQSEMEIRKQGKWEEYEQSIMKANYVASLKGTIEELQGLHDSVSSPEVIHADDTNILMIEKWHVNVDQIKQDLMKDITELKELLRKAEEESIYGSQHPKESQ